MVIGVGCFPSKHFLFVPPDNTCKLSTHAHIGNSPDPHIKAVEASSAAAAGSSTIVLEPTVSAILEAVARRNKEHTGNNVAEHVPEPVTDAPTEVGLLFDWI